MKKITSLAEITENRYIIFKHSATCPISASAHKAVSGAIDRMELPVYQVVVQENRELSTEVARKFGVIHESPQVILIKDDQAVWNESHYGITTDTLISVSERHSV
jgi:bacillithiol system protein YtxJ